MTAVLDLISGVCWSVTYVAAVVLGVRKKIWYIPKLAICQNFAWEFWVVMERILTGSPLSTAFVIQIAWLALDVGVLFTWVHYDRGDPRNKLGNATLFLGVFALMYLLAFRLGAWEFTAFAINAIMSAAFLLRENREEDAPKSCLIAVTKLVGTLAATILNGIIWRNMLLLWLGGICLLFDGRYLAVCARKFQGKG